MARPSKINETVIFKDPKAGTETELSLTDAMVRYLEAGSFIGNACEAIGISAQTLSVWRSRGAAWLAPDGERLEDIPESEMPFVEFLEATTRAASRGVVFHELNLRRHADEDWRASAFFLERRQPARYSKRIEIDTDPGDRDPAPLSIATAAEVEEAFITAHVPEGIEPAGVVPPLPALPPGPPAEEDEKVSGDA